MKRIPLIITKKATSENHLLNPKYNTGSVRGVLLIATKKAISGSQNEGWARQLAGRSISPMLKDVNISFNYPPYYLMSKSDGREISQAGSLGNKA